MTILLQSIQALILSICICIIYINIASSLEWSFSLWAILHCHTIHLLSIFCEEEQKAIKSIHWINKCKVVSTRLSFKGSRSTRQCREVLWVLIIFCRLFQAYFQGDRRLRRPLYSYFLFSRCDVTVILKYSNNK